MFKIKREANLRSLQLRCGFRTLIVINSGTLIQDINFFCANEKYEWNNFEPLHSLNTN